jgi:hypothetical protein
VGPSRLRPAAAVVEGAPARPDRLAVGVAVALVADAVHHGALADAAPVRVPARRHVRRLVAPATAVPPQALVCLDICRRQEPKGSSDSRGTASHVSVICLAVHE